MLLPILLVLLSGTGTVPVTLGTFEGRVYIFPALEGRIRAGPVLEGEILMGVE